MVSTLRRSGNSFRRPVRSLLAVLVVLVMIGGVPYAGFTVRRAAASAGSVSGHLSITPTKPDYSNFVSPFYGARVRVEGTDISATVSSPDGAFTLSNVPPGQVTLIVDERPGYDHLSRQSKRKTVNVPPGGLADVSIELEWNWEEIPSYPIDPSLANGKAKAFFVSGEVGYILYGPSDATRHDGKAHWQLWRTENGGNTWDMVYEWAEDEFPRPETDNCYFFADRDHGYIPAVNELPGGGAPLDTGILSTSNGGSSWTYSRLDNPYDDNGQTWQGWAHARIFAAITPDSVIAGGSSERYQGAGVLQTGYVIWETSDAGNSWVAKLFGGSGGENMVTGLGADPSGTAVAFITDDVAGAEPHLRAWRDPATGSWSKTVSDFYVHSGIHSTRYVPMLGNKAWAPARDGIRVTEDGGATWSAPISTQAENVDYADENVAWRQSGTDVYFTYDGGHSWLKQAESGGTPDHTGDVWAFSMNSAVFQDGNSTLVNGVPLEIFRLNQPAFADWEVVPGVRLQANTYVPAGARDVPVLSLRLSNRGTEDITVSSLTFHASGTGNDASDIESVSLYVDINVNGVVDPDDAPLGSGVYSGDDGQVTFTLTPNLLVKPYADRYLLLAYDIASTALPGRTYRAGIVPPSDVVASVAPTGPSGYAHESRIVNIVVDEKFSDDFESGLGSWTTDGTDIVWVLDESESASPTHSARIGAGFPMSEARNLTLAQPLNFQGVQKPVLTFKDRYLLEYLGGYGYIARVFVSTNGGASWTPVLTMSPVQQSMTLRKDYFGQQDVDLSAYAGSASVLMRFGLYRSTGAPSGSFWAIDDVKVWDAAAASSPGQFKLANSSYTVSEGAGSATISVARTNGSSGSVTVSYATSDGTASAGADYVATSGVLTFDDGETTKQFTVTVLDDEEAEGDETVNITLSDPTGGATLGSPSTAVLTITDDDAPSVTFDVCTASGNTIRNQGFYYYFTEDVPENVNGTVRFWVATSQPATVTANLDGIVSGATVTVDRDAYTREGSDYRYEVIYDLKGKTVVGDVYQEPLRQIPVKVKFSDSLSVAPSFVAVLNINPKVLVPGLDGPDTTDWSTIPDFSRADIVLHKAGYGRVALSGLNLLDMDTANRLKSLGQYLNLADRGSAEFDVTQLPAFQNKAANVTLYGLPYTSEPDIRAFAGGVEDETIAVSDKSYDSQTGTLSFAAEHFTAFKAVPRVAVTTPSDGSSTAARSVTVRGTVNDPGATVQVRLGNGAFQDATVAADGSFSKEISLAVGVNVITVKAMNDIGESRPVSVSITRVGQPSTGAGPSSGPTATEPSPGPVVAGNVADVSGAVTVEKRLDDTGETIQEAAITTPLVEQALAATGPNGRITLLFPERAQQHTVTLPAGAFSAMASKSGSLEVRTPTAALVVPAVAAPVAEAAEELGVSPEAVSVRLTMREVPPGEAERIRREAAPTMAFLRPLASGVFMEFRFEAVAGDKTAEVDLAGTLEGQLCYEPGDVQGLSDLRKMNVYRFDEQNRRWVPVRTRVDAARHKLVFYTESLSYYAAMICERTFADVAQHWAREDIELMAAKHVISGYSDDSFAPEQAITRAEFAAMLSRALWLTPGTYDRALFADVVPGAWYAGYVKVAAEAGLIAGYDDHTFRPDSAISRQEMAVMLSRALRVAGSQVSVTGDEQAGLLSAFSDSGSVCEWAKADVARVLKAGLLRGDDRGALKPASSASRSQAAVMLRRLMEISGLM